MPNFTAGTSFTDGVTNDVTAAKLNALVADAVPTSSLSLNSTTGTIATFNSTTGTITTGVIPTLTSTTLITTGTGTAAAPAIVPTGDTNTGVFYPAADTIAATTNGTERLRIDSSGQVGIGTTNPQATLDVSAKFRVDTSNNFGAISFARPDGTHTPFIRGADNAGASALRLGELGGAQSAIDIAPGIIAFYTNTATTERMRIDSSGNVGIGQSSLTSTLTVNKAGTDTVIQMQEGGTNTAQIESFQSSLYLNVAGANNIIFRPNSTERLRITSSGDVLIGATDSNPGGGSVGFKFVYNTTNPFIGIVSDLSGDSTNYHLYNKNATNNGYRFYVNLNGGISNFSANNTNLSDERLKTNISPAGNYLDKICSIPVKTFNYKDQGEDTEKTIGIIAQDVEAVIPELINNDGFGETPEDGIPLKTIYQTDIQYVLMRCIQELSAKVTALEAS